MPFIIQNNGKPQIQSHIAFCELLNNTIPEQNQNLGELFNRMNNSIREIADVSPSALSNVNGDWYEWLIAIQAWNDFINSRVFHLAIPLPNVSGLDITSLYIPELHNLITDLKNKVQQTNVELITSNPDFVIINGDHARKILHEPQIIERISHESLFNLNSVYTSFLNSCQFENIIGYLSVKKSLRPDRRLQWSHEGSLIKALYKHIQTRKWILNPKGIRYYGMSTYLSPADIIGLRTVATHSIITVETSPDRAVDEVFVVNSLQQAQVVFDQILRND
jgi:hypothetical protein